MVRPPEISSSHELTSLAHPHRSTPIKTLIVDNFDSFTYNLYHYFASINGQEPTVISNNFSQWKTSDLAAFDNVIISPGPGSPEKTPDFGICADIISNASLPLLGICLGHQGLGLSHGASLARVHQAAHGVISAITHCEDGLFRGIPSPFNVTRYHSLKITDIKDPLKVSASTLDGIIMGVEHRLKPQWGVQFHPESICTDYGFKICQNFANLTEEYWSNYGSREVINLPEKFFPANKISTFSNIFQAANRNTTSPHQFEVSWRVLPFSEPVADIFYEFFSHAPHSVWLDSNGAITEHSRFSILTGAIGTSWRFVHADVTGSKIFLEDASGEKYSVSQPFFDWLEKELASYSVSPTELPFDFRLGWLGYLGYELGGAPESSPDFLSVPAASLLFVDRAMVFDHQTGELYLLGLSDCDEKLQELNIWFAQVQDRLMRLPKAPDCSDYSPISAWSARHSKSQYLQLIAAGKEHIAAGDSYELCLTNTLYSATKLDALRSYLKLRALTQPPFGAFLRLGAVEVASTSPESFLRITPDKVAFTSPIKGTRARLADHNADLKIRADLSSSLKDRAENLMIVDLARHDLGRTALPGSVVVSELFAVKSFPKAHQLVSTIQSQIGPQFSSLDCVRAAFPPGSMTGAPKLRSMELLAVLEAGPRGVYSGAIGYFSLNGAVDLSVAIRTLTVTDQGSSYGVGGAVIALSDPGEEFEETVVKASPLLELLTSEVDFGCRTVLEMP